MSGGAWPRWSADAGGTCRVDAPPLAKKPKVRWIRKGLGQAHGLLASEAGVVVAPLIGYTPLHVLDPATGETRVELAGATFSWLEGPEADELVLVRHSVRRLKTGEEIGRAPPDSIDPSECAVVGELSYRLAMVKRKQVTQAVDVKSGAVRFELPGHVAMADEAGSVTRVRGRKSESLEVYSARGEKLASYEGQYLEALALAPGHVVAKRGDATDAGFRESAVVLERSTGAELARHERWTAPGRVAIARDVLYVPLVDPVRLLAVGLDGEKRWELSLAGQLDNVAAVAVGAGRLFLLGSIYGVDASGVAKVDQAVVALE